MIQLHKFLTLNCSIVYGRLGKYYPHETSRYLKECLKKVCYGFIVCQSEEQSKHDAFRGLNEVINLNPMDFLLNVAFYLEAAGLYKDPPEDVRLGIQKILADLLKGSEEVQKTASEAYGQCSQKAKQGLKTKYGFPSAN